MSPNLPSRSILGVEYCSNTWSLVSWTSIKQLHCDIKLSATYRLRTGRYAGNEGIDAGNRYYWRADRRRLDAESLRDALLHFSGGLDAKASLHLDDEEHDRRTLYGSVSRFQLDGVNGGMTYGVADDFGFRAVENPVRVHDLHATILHLPDIDHEKLTYRYSGRDYRLTDVHGRVHDIIA